jgi:hypothetical protein
MTQPRQWVVDLLRHAGYVDVAREAERDLPDPVTMERVYEFADEHGISHDEIMGRMGGSP